MHRVLLSIMLFLSLGAIHIPGSQAQELNKQQAASIAQAKYPGRVIDVKLINENTYQVKILNENGSMHIVIIEKESGNIQSAN